MIRKCGPLWTEVALAVLRNGSWFELGSQNKKSSFQYSAFDVASNYIWTQGCYAAPPIKKNFDYELAGQILKKTKWTKSVSRGKSQNVLKMNEFGKNWPTGLNSFFVFYLIAKIEFYYGLVLMRSQNNSYRLIDYINK